jgi:hypothetical protein
VLAVFLALLGGDLAPVLLVGLLAMALVAHLVLEIATAEVLEEPHEGPFGGTRVPAAFVRASVG